MQIDGSCVWLCKSFGGLASNGDIDEAADASDLSHALHLQAYKPAM